MLDSQHIVRLQVGEYVMAAGFVPEMKKVHQKMCPMVLATIIRPLKDPNDEVLWWCECSMVRQFDSTFGKGW